ncbi:creatininase family protein [Rathayibacter sp. Leaf296]|uniref:creatininase family protein n=1 Tax=Rathayibacter sp. Leaf296 TaxID=1736327 RepID=UPI000703756A|nr:creatininase family protein [Rathayibacter sp. Leaf296]KQQ09573.1 creatinine amidohydrolase [Rathayibacter sp. Leaf296]
MSRRFHELPGSDIATTLTAESVLVVPIGAIEHHGPHLPLHTDTLIAESVATQAVDRAAASGVDTWILPTLSIAKSDEHHWAPGTLWLRAETVLDTIVDLGNSLTTTPATTLVFVNGHGGNGALLQMANRELRRRFGLRTFSMAAGRTEAGDGREGRPDEKGLGIHAGYGETSVVMHLRPDLVHPERFARNVPEHIADYQHIGFNGTPVSFGWLSDDFGPTGVVGDPTGATGEVGALLFEEKVAFVASALEEISRFRYR